MGDLGFGVWLFFENSTGCLISQCQLVWLSLLAYRLVMTDSFGSKFIVVGMQVFPQILLESLILAQDERWRRA